MSENFHDAPQPAPTAENADIPSVHMLYALATFVVYAVIWDVGGIMLGLVVVVLWAMVFYSRSRPRTFTTIFCLIILLGGCLVSLTGYTSRETARRFSCKSNLKQIMLAMHNYHDVYDSFPPAYIPDENGKPIHSWRVLLLPYLDQQSLYEQYDFRQPWDSPKNLKLLDKMPNIYSCPSHAARSDNQHITSYLAVVGPDTGWPGSDGRPMGEFEDGTSNTMMVIESHTSDIPWTAPQDLSLNEAQRHLASTDFETFGGHRRQAFFYEYLDGHHVAFADGSVQIVPAGLDPDLTADFFLINNGGPAAGWDLIPNWSDNPSRVRWNNVIRFTTSLVWALVPVPWVWWNPTGSRVSEAADS